jgi:transposase
MGLAIGWGSETWVETCLLPVLQPGQVVILDNATFHKGGRIQQLIEQAGAQILYLPPYSPDLNKIENCWSWLHLSRSQASGSV